MAEANFVHLLPGGQVVGPTMIEMPAGTTVYPCSPSAREEATVGSNTSHEDVATAPTVAPSTAGAEQLGACRPRPSNPAGH